MAHTIDSIVIQITDAANGGTEARALVQQLETEDGSSLPVVKSVTYASLTTAEKSAWDLLMGAFQTTLDA